MRLLLLLFAFAVCGQAGFAQTEGIACNIMHDGTFKDLGDEDPSAYFIIDGDEFIDYSNNGLNVSKSVIEWENDCSYVLTLTETNIPELKKMIGFQLRGTITSVDGNTIEYKQILANQEVERTLVKLTKSEHSNVDSGQIEVFSEILIF